MRTIRFVFIILITVSFIQCNQPAKKDLNDVENQTNHPQVAMLGVFHFAGSTGDVASVSVDNILGERRQREIDTILSRLETLKPNKILVEYPYGRNEQLNESYQKYLNGNKELTENEIHQLGFKLGKRLGHKELYAVDYKMNLPFDQLQNFAKSYGKEQELNNFVENLQKNAKEKSKYLEENTILDYLLELNTDSSDLWNKNLYLGQMLEMGKDSLYPGAEIAGQWYKRNMYMLANISRVAEPNDRILFIVGSGHRSIMKQFIIDKHDMEYIEIHDYLKK